MTDKFDVIVLGLGVGGEEVGGRLAEAGLSVLGIEERLVGGECPYYGCIPSKMMIRAANLVTEARRIEGMAGHADVRPSWAPVAARIRDEATDNWDDKVAVERFTGKGGTFVRGRGRIVGPGRVAVGDQVYEAERGVVVGIGTSPAIPPIEGLAQAPYWTNREAIEVAELPQSLIVLGGGAIGLELTQAFARFGVQVTVIEALDRLLAMEEPESSSLIEKVLTDEGITLLIGQKAIRVDGTTVFLDNGTKVSAERLLIATGRKVDVAGVGLDTLGGDLAERAQQARAIVVDERMRAGDGLWAVGDCTGHGAFTHMAMYQAGIAVADILGRSGPVADYRATPRVTFTDPEIGAVGLTEQQARAKGLRVQVGYTDITTSTRGWIHRAGNAGFIKLVVDADRGVLVGATSAGPTGGEVLSALSVAVHGEVPVASLQQMIYAYPTFHRAISEALKTIA